MFLIYYNSTVVNTIEPQKITVTLKVRPPQTLPYLVRQQ